MFGRGYEESPSYTSDIVLGNHLKAIRLTIFIVLPMYLILIMDTRSCLIYSSYDATIQIDMLFWCFPDKNKGFEEKHFSYKNTTSHSVFQEKLFFVVLFF